MVTEAKGIRGRVCERDTAHSILPHALHLPSTCRQIKALLNISSKQQHPLIDYQTLTKYEKQRTSMSLKGLID